jgi:hypothetical protein
MGPDRRDDGTILRQLLWGAGGRGKLLRSLRNQGRPCRGGGKGQGDEAARYLEEITNREASDGWEFQRVDTMTVLEPPGCLGGNQPKETAVYIMTFRRAT